jgi:hypothetical protein
LCSPFFLELFYCIIVLLLDAHLGLDGLIIFSTREDPFKGMSTSSMWYALEGSKLQLENKGGDGRVRPWDENVLSLVGMTKGPPTLEFLEEKKYLNL